MVGEYNPKKSNKFLVYRSNSGGFGDRMANFFGGIGGWQGALGTAAQLAPTIYNTIQGIRKPTQRDAQQFQNPQYNQAINLMANRRYDPTQQLRDIEAATAMGRYNLANKGASAGQQYAGIQGLMAQRMRESGKAWQHKALVDAQYMGEEAKMRAGLGSEEAANRYRVDQDNLAAQAMRRTHFGTGTSQLSQWAQMQQLMKNQQARDMRLEDLIRAQGPYAAQWAGLV